MTNNFFPLDRKQFWLRPAFIAALLVVSSVVLLYSSRTGAIGIDDGGGDDGGGPPPATASITANGQAGSISVAPGSSVAIAWFSSNVSSCSVSPGGGSGTSGSQNVTVNSTTTYSVSCDSGAASSSVLVSIASGGPGGLAHPDLDIRLGDGGGSSPSLPGQCGNQLSAWGKDAADSDDADCIQVRVNNQSATYTDDFQICFGMNGGQQCTPWASQGGGGTGVIVNGNSFTYAYVRVNYRTTPTPGMYFSDVSVGVQLFYRSNGGSCGPSSGIARAYGTPGQPAESPWAFGAQKDDDPGCGAMYMQAKANLPNDAKFISENFPDTASKNTAYSGKIVMQNTGATWTADQSTPLSGNCSNFNPTAAGQTCTETKEYSSSNFKLVRKDDTSAITAPAQLDFRRQITYTHTAVEYQWCEPDPPPPPGDGDGPELFMTSRPSPLHRLANLLSGLVKTVQAQENCTSTLGTQVTSSGQSDVFYQAEADFPFSLSTTVSGTFTLQYRMKQLNGIPNGNPAGEFGEIATVSITVTAGNATYSLVCTPPDLGKIKPQDPNPTFNVLATTANGYDGFVTLSATSVITGTQTPGNLTIDVTNNQINPSGSPTNTNATISGFQPNTSYTVNIAGSPPLADGSNPSCQVAFESKNVDPPKNVSRFVSWSVPKTTLQVGEKMVVNITMKNCPPVTPADGTAAIPCDAANFGGFKTWKGDTSGGSNPQPHRLGFEGINQRDQDLWGMLPYHNRVAMDKVDGFGGWMQSDHSGGVAPGENVTFTFTIVAPSSPGQYNMRFGMVQDAVEWMDGLQPSVPANQGEPTPNQVINVVPQPTYALACTPPDLGTIQAGGPNPVFNVLASTSDSFNSYVTLSATSVIAGTQNPGNLTISFTNNQINPSGSPTNTNATISGFQPNTSYTVNVYGSPNLPNGTTPYCQVNFKVGNLPPTLTSITILPDPATIKVAQTQAYTVSAKYSDNSTKDVTNDPGTSYTSSNPVIASIPLHSPVATGKAIGGPIDIKAQYGGKEDTAKLSVNSPPCEPGNPGCGGCTSNCGGCTGPGCVEPPCTSNCGVKVENSATNAAVACGKIRLSWNGFTGQIDGYHIYRNSSFLKDQTTSPLSPDDTPPAGGSYTYGVQAYNNGPVPNTSAIVNSSPVSPVDCTPDLSGSDKDVWKLNGNAITNANIDGKSDAIPASVAFKGGDTVTFVIHVRNLGLGAVVNPVVADTMTLVQNPSNFQYTSGCKKSPESIGGSNPPGGNPTVTFYLNNIAPSGICTITYNAVIYKPATTSADCLLHYKNQATISSTSLSPRTVTTPLVLYSVCSGPPDRHETPP